MPSNHLIFCCLLLFCLQSFPASGFFPVSWLCIGWPKYWCFSLSKILLYVQGWFPLGVTGLLLLVSHSVMYLCDPMNCSMPGFPVPDYILEFAQTHIHWVGDAIQSSHAVSSPSPPSLNLSQHQCLFQWVGSLHQVAKVLELQHQSFQWIFRVDFQFFSTQSSLWNNLHMHIWLLEILSVKWEIALGRT